MATKLQSLVIVAATLIFGSSGSAAETQADPLTQEVNGPSVEQLSRVHQMRHQAAMREYAARITEFKAGRSPANVVLQANRRLLRATLATDSPNAAVEYDRRAAEIETLAQKNLELGTGTTQEVAQARSARLDAILKDLLGCSDSNDKQSR